MGTGNALAEAALETLPITVAVVDADGEILLTNQSWREFGPDEVSRDDVGVDYLATARMDDDDHAQRAVAGLEAVLDGDRETFAMEYPCHTPDEKQWFLMRASRFAVDGETRVSVVHLEITERKLAELAVEETASELREERGRLEHVLERVDGLLRDVTDAAVGARTREEVEREVCTRLAATEPYVLAWIGRVDVTNSRLSPREWAGRDTVPLEEDALRLDAESHATHPAVRAIENDEPAVIDDIETFADAERWWPTGGGDRFRSVAAFPLSYGDVSYGVLVVFAADADAFTEREQIVLDSLAGTIATSMNAIQARRMLTADTAVELEVSIADADPFVAALATALDATVSFRGLTDTRDGRPIAVLHVDSPVASPPPVEDVVGVADVDVLSTYEGGTLLEAAVTDDLLAAVTDHGGSIRRLEAATTTPRPSRKTQPRDVVVDLTLDLSDGQSARSVYDYLEDRYDAVELRSYHERDRPPQTPRETMARLESSLTERQLTALRTAHHADYFEWPRNVSGEDLAGSMDISRSTFHQHLRAAQRKLLDELFEDTPTSKG